MPDPRPAETRRGLVVAGTASGSGKTTVSTALVLLLAARGLRVQPFKCGPDYIDPGYLSRAAGRPCRNLDSWMLPADVMREVLRHATADANTAVIEGVMGLFDGRRGLAAEGSTAEIATAFDAPVLLVIDAAKMSASAAAIVNGFRDFDPAVRLVGVIANNIGSPNHLRGVRQAIESRSGLPLVGYLPKNADLCLPERHLGLVPAVERANLDTYLKRLREQAAETFDLDAIIKLLDGSALRPPVNPGGLFPDAPAETRARIAVARDDAFNFYYQDNLDMLTARGAEIVPVSPLHDPGLPPDADGIYLGGGFPEVFAEKLSANTAFREDLSKRAAAGMPVYAECGGLLYLCRSITDFDGKCHPMAGSIPAAAVMGNKRRRLGYAEAEATTDSILLKQGETVRGHLFHWSDVGLPPERAAYQLTDPADGPEGFIGGSANNILASYLHLHFGTRPQTAENFVKNCATWAQKGRLKPGSHTR
jgi:cobyrinic acid a,c-diamide synthase